eukprot:4669295-Alexandrium_andersonii.AAC.1
MLQPLDTHPLQVQNGPAAEICGSASTQRQRTRPACPQGRGKHSCLAWTWPGSSRTTGSASSSAW